MERVEAFKCKYCGKVFVGEDAKEQCLKHETEHEEKERLKQTKAARRKEYEDAFDVAKEAREIAGSLLEKFLKDYPEENKHDRITTIPELIRLLGM